MRTKSRVGGVTLLELVLVVALVALLGTIAIPTYRKIVERAHTHAAIAKIGELSLQIYRWETNAGRFPNSLAEAGLGTPLDPWQRPYVYVNIATASPGDVRRDKNLVPINTDFDLYSLGEDGKTATPLTAAASQDDVVRANNGGFIGSAKDY
jgi:general secretion pathway protein G